VVSNIMIRCDASGVEWPCQVETAEACASAAGLVVTRRWDMLPKEGFATPKFVIFEMRKRALADGASPPALPLCPLALPTDFAGRPSVAVSLAVPAGGVPYPVYTVPLREVRGYWSPFMSRVRRDMGMPCFSGPDDVPAEGS